MKKFLATLLAAAMVFSLAACGGKSEGGSGGESSGAESGESQGGESESTEPSGGGGGDSSEMVSDLPALSESELANATLKKQVVIGLNKDLVTLDPYASNNVEVSLLLRMTHSHLVKQDPRTYELQPDLATDWEVTDEYIDFTIRDDAKFHNGDPVTIEDIIYSFDVMKENSYTSSKVSFIDHIEKIDDTHIRMHLAKNNQDALRILAYFNVCIVSEKESKADEANGRGIGSGPYKVAEWELGSHTLLERFDDYFGEKPLTESFLMKTQPEDSQRVISFENGETDICIAPPAQEVEHIASSDKSMVMAVTANKLVYIAINQNGNHKALADKKVRQAIAHAINRENIIIAAKDGKAKLANTVISPKTAYYNPDQEAMEYDPELAKQLLSETDFADGFEMTISFIDGTTYKTIAQLFQADLAAIGITVKVDPKDNSSMKTLMAEEKHEAIIYNWGPTPGEGPDITFRSLFMGGSGSNRQVLNDEWVNETIEAAAVETDEAKRQDLYYQLQEWMIDNAGFLPMYYEILYMGVNKNLHNFNIEPSEQHTFTYCYVTE
jgi:peptide/nickel transport system substrate-binding protein